MDTKLLNQFARNQFSFYGCEQTHRGKKLNVKGIEFIEQRVHGRGLV
jgi:hypothetical protein